MDIRTCLLASLMLAGMMSSAAMSDYFVGKNGKDTNSGADWNNSFLTIQHAIDQIPAGGTGKIVVAQEPNNIYFEDLVCNGKNVELYGEPGSAFTVGGKTFNPGPTIRGTGGSPVIFTDGPSSGSYTVKISNFYINNGYGKLEGNTTFGGGIYVTAGHNLEMYNCVVSDNYAQEGAGVLVGTTSTAGIQQCWFLRNGEKTAGSTSKGPAVWNNNPNEQVVINSCLACSSLNNANANHPFDGVNGVASFTLQGGVVEYDSACPKPELVSNLCASDTDMDGDTDIEDLLNVIEGWGTTCP